jgi:type II secretory pathway component PulF
LRVTRIEPEPKKKPTAVAFRAAEFLAFNQQLAQLTSRGLPIERSLRLMAGEIRSRRQARAIRQIADDLEAGKPLSQAFGDHRGGFPPLYGRLLDAGVRTNNLSAMLLNLGRHVELLQRLRGAMWRAASYPLMVLTALLLVLGFIWIYIIPRLLSLAGPLILYKRGRWGFLTTNGPVTGTVLDTFLPIAWWISSSIMTLIGIVLLSVVFFSIVARLSFGRRLLERLVIPIPLVGPVVRWNLLARWCDALHLGVQAGLDLPAALALASDAVDSAALRSDTRRMIDAVSAGQSLDSLIESTRMLPPVVPASLQLGAEQNDLPATTAMLAKMYQEQSEVRLGVLPQVLSPLLLILTAVCIGLAIASALLPMVLVLRTLMR